MSDAKGLMSIKIGVIGMGYVGLPLAVSLADRYPTVGYDLSSKRIDDLNSGVDHTHEVEPADLKKKNLNFTDSLDSLENCNFYIVAVPTPVDESKTPDLTYVKEASKAVASKLKQGDTVVYESTVYPGTTEDICAPILEEISQLKCGEGFNIGYSPERVNPGDKQHTLSKITKVISAQNPDTLNLLEAVYSSVVNAGVFKAKSIRVAEAAKLVENIQRDVNIALMNELALIFDRMDLDTLSVLKAAGTKWNFLKFNPGLVGGHCIGVDPYYLTHRAQMAGYIPQVILSGRRINDDMGRFIADKCIKEMVKAGHDIGRSIVSIFGVTFKENCPDIRNSRVFDVINELKSYGVHLQVQDECALPEKVYQEFGLELKVRSDMKAAHALVFCVPHEGYKNMQNNELERLAQPGAVLIDVKGIFQDEQYKAFQNIWRL